MLHHEICTLKKSTSKSRPALEQTVPKQYTKSHHSSPKLTQREVEVYELISEDFLTTQQISSRLQVSIRWVNKIKLDLKKKGYLDVSGFISSKNPTPVSLNGFKDHKITIKQWRLHKLHFLIKPYYFFPRYHKIRKEKGNYGINYREWMIKLHSDTVEVQLQAKEDFKDPDKWQAVLKCDYSFNRMLREVCNKFGFSVWKEGKANIRMVDHHLARNPSEIANARDGEHMIVRGEDGRVWFSIDKSKGAEHEYTHADRALTDSETVEPYLNDWLYKNPPKNSDLSSFIMATQKQLGDLTQAQFHTQQQIQQIVTILTPQQAQESKIERVDYVG